MTIVLMLDFLRFQKVLMFKNGGSKKKLPTTTFYACGINKTPFNDLFWGIQGLQRPNTNFLFR